MVLKEESKDEDVSPREQLIDDTRGQYKKVQETLKIRGEDSWFMIVGKALLTVLAIGLLILLSPVILLVLIFAFFAAF